MVFAINLPIVYKLRVPNAVSVDTRPTNAPPVLAGNSTLFKAPPVNRPRSTKAATPLCRVRAQMLGYLPEARELVAGELDDERLQNDWDGKDSNVGHFRKLQNNVGRYMKIYRKLLTEAGNDGALWAESLVPNMDRRGGVCRPAGSLDHKLVLRSQSPEAISPSW